MTHTKEIEIKRVGLEGQGVGYDEEGNIYFVPQTLPGDHVRVGFGTLKKYRDATLLEVLSTSLQTVKSECKYFHQCGGCDWLNWKYEEQLKAKEEILRHVLERGTLTPEKFLPMLGAKNTLGYRNRIQLKARGKEIGFFKRHTHDIIDLESCAVAHPKLNAHLAKMRATRTFDKPTRVELFINESGEVVESLDAQSGAQGFAQINDEQNENLKNLLKKHIEESNSKQVLELYAGDGNLTFAYLPLVKQVLAFDFSAPAIQTARERRDALGEEGKKVSFFKDMVDAKLKAKLPEDFVKSYDTIVLDPPRSGAGDFLDKFLHANVKTIIYVSCSPVAFSQDVQAFKKDFKLEQIQPIDMFPQTRHIEFVAKFVRV